MEKQRKSGENLSVVLLNNKAIIILVVIIIASTILTQGKTLTGLNLGGVARQTAVSAMLGMSMTLMLSIGAANLSLAHTVNLISILFGIISLSMPLWFAILMAIVLGVFLNLFNGIIAYSFDLPPFIVTLATAQVFRGFAFIFADGKSITGLSDEVKYLGQGVVLGAIPFSTIVMAIVSIFVAILVYKMKFGRHLIATGANHEAARVSGINIKKTRLVTFAIAGAIAGVAAVTLTGRVGTALPAGADGMEMDAIAAVVIGGTPMSGGKANVLGSLMGVLIIGFISNTMNLLNISSFWQFITKGLLIIFAVVLDSQTEKIISRKQGVA